MGGRAERWARPPQAPRAHQAVTTVPGKARPNRRIYADRRHPPTALNHGNRVR